MKDEEQMALDNINLIYKVLKDRNILNRIDDLYDIGMIGLVRGIKSYDESKGIKESTYLYACINREITKNYRKETAKKRSLYKEISLNTIIVNKDGEKGSELIDFIEDESINIENQIEDDEEYVELISLINKLNKGQKEIICSYYGLNGYKKIPISELKKNLGVSRQALFAKKNRALASLKKLYEKNIERTTR